MLPGHCPPRHNTEEFTASLFRWVIVKDLYLNLLGTIHACVLMLESGMEVRCALLRKWNKTERHHPRGV